AISCYSSRRDSNKRWQQDASRCDECARVFQGFSDLRSILACTAGIVRTAAALPADHRRDLVNQFVRLKFRAEFFRNGSNQCNVSIFCTREKNWAAEFWLKCVHDCLEQFRTGICHACNTAMLESLADKRRRSERTDAVAQVWRRI